MKRKVEREPTEYIAPDWCAKVCINHDRPGCVYDCAQERKARFFLPDPEMTLEDIAPFPAHEWHINSTPQERQAIAGLYLEKITQELTGVAQNEDDDRLQRELEGASDERLLEIVGEIIGNGHEVER